MNPNKKRNFRFERDFLREERSSRSYKRRRGLRRDKMKANRCEAWR